MKLICLSDMHLVGDNPIGRIDNLIVTQFIKLSQIVDFIKAHPNDVFHTLQAGDFTDKPRSWLLLSLLVSFFKRTKMHFFCVRGQHDSYMNNEDSNAKTILGLLSKVGYVSILNQTIPFILGNKVHVYGTSYEKTFPKTIKEEGFYNILVIHAPIAQKPLFEGHVHFDAYKFLKEYIEFDLILCGDIHREFCIVDHGRVILNTGPMLRKDAEEYSFTHEPKFYLLHIDEDKGKLLNIDTIKFMCSPAEEILSRKHIENKIEAETILSSFIATMKSDFKVEANFDANLANFIRENKINDDVIRIIGQIKDSCERRE